MVIKSSHTKESKMPSRPAKRGENNNPGENQTKTEIINFGNSCSAISLARTKEELDTVLHVTKATELLKDQTKYRLLVVEQKITLGKNKQTLYDTPRGVLVVTLRIPVTRTIMMNE